MLKIWNRDDLPVFKDQRGPQVGEGPDKHDDGPCEIARQHQRKSNRPKQLKPARTQVASSFLEAWIHIGQGRCHVEVHNGIEVEHL